MNRLAYKKQRNYCVSLLRQNKKQYYRSLNVNHTTDNENFWRVVSNFSNKILGTNRVILRDGDKITSDREKVADTFHKLFANIGKTFTRIDKDKQFVVETNDVIDPVLKAIKGTLMQV